MSTGFVQLNASDSLERIVAKINSNFKNVMTGNYDTSALSNSLARGSNVSMNTNRTEYSGGSGSGSAAYAEIVAAIAEARAIAQEASDATAAAAQVAMTAGDRAEEAADIADDARTLAAGYTQYVWSDTEGLHVTAADGAFPDDSESAIPNLLINTQGMDIYSSTAAYNAHTASMHLTKSDIKFSNGTTEYSSLSTEGLVLKDGTNVLRLTPAGTTMLDGKARAAYTADGIAFYSSDGTTERVTINNEGLQFRNTSGEVTAYFGENAIELGNDNSSITSVTMKGNAVLNVTSLCIGDFSDPIHSRAELKGDKGEDGKDGTDGRDITSQYVYYNSSYGLAITPTANSTTGKHLQLKTDGVYIKDSTTTLASFTASSIQFGNSNITTIKFGGWGYIAYLNSAVYISPMSANTNIGLGITLSGIEVGGVSGSQSGTINCGDITSTGPIIARYSSTVDIVASTSSSSYNVGMRSYASTSNPSRHGIYTGTGSATDFNNWMVYADGAGGTVVNTSSSKWRKENIKNLTDSEAVKLLDIEIVTFDYKLDDGKEDYANRKGWIGCIAEDTYGIIPRAVTCSDEYEDLADMIERGENTSKLGIDYGTFTPYLIKLCQMQQAQIDDLTARITALEEKLS